ncbi:putative phosphatase, C-terminal domain of histone macro H2A1 like protein [Spongiibacter sp. IMCC21906]|uniref:type II toxin-antitoxin system antitoxin DNA ADP-ribosyl glycohydrolase DarG n=1 Tax=Spongiibacter sp. IMCC21906 TaxID=1620392 RepID=UPI00062DDB2F|nr:macro domain-containing protein [Spongiibacter sp. IMCC21906]AKH70084.1 putative phosphatase, C-terminal domain of histone macro H2A1 like protein [Spongiibacter sp. IMCC21906]
MAIVTTSGDLLKQHDVDAIVNTVNCVGVMGKGIALQFKKKWPQNFKAYSAACKAGQVKPGSMFVYDLGGLATPRFIINFPTKAHWRNASKLADIESGLADLLEVVRERGIGSIVMPPLGCGNGGLDWRDVRPLIERYFAEVDIELRLFEPQEGAAPVELEVNTPAPKMTPGRAAILALLKTYQALDYGLSKIEVQKLAYFLQEAGQSLKLNFVKDKFGPYADNLRHALDRMDGHYLHGVGDGVVESQITPDDTALAEANRYLQEIDPGVLKRVSEVAELIEGFQSPFGMELLASVHWVATREGATNAYQALSKVQAWNPRKKQIMTQSHVNAAWQQLETLGWIPVKGS